MTELPMKEFLHKQELYLQMIGLYPNEPKYLRQLIALLLQQGKDHEAMERIQQLERLYTARGNQRAAKSLKNLYQRLLVRGESITSSVTPFLSGIKPEAIHMLMQYAEEVRIDESTVLIRQGDCDNSMYIVLDGELAVLVRYQGKEDMTLIHMLKEGDIVGEMAFLEKHTRSATVIANSDVTVLKLSLQCVLSCMLRFPEVGEYLCQESALRNCLRAINGNSMLVKLPHGAKYELALHAKLVRYPAFSVLSKPEQVLDWTGVLVSGLVWIMLEEHDEHKDFFEKIKPGQMIADTAALRKDACMVGMIAVKDSDVLQIQADKFREIMQDNPFIEALFAEADM